MPSSPAPTDVIVAVAVPVPGLGLLSYRTPGRSSPPAKGARVDVRVGSRSLVGIVVDPSAACPEHARLRDVTAVLDDEPFLPAPVVDLALWVGEYYAAGPGDALAVAMPPSARRAAGGGFRTRSIASIVPGAAVQETALHDAGVPRSDGPDAASPGAGAPKTAARSGASVPSPRGRRQQEALAILADHPAGIALADLQRRGIGRAVVRALEASGRVVVRTEVVERDPFGGQDGSTWSMAARPGGAVSLTGEQAEALDRLRAAADRGTYQTVLLHGVTGSGKTEVYLRLTMHVLASGRRALVLVPEIALTPALVGLFRARFGGRVAIQHSGLSAGERHDQWHRIRRGDVDVVVGTRSAVFAPIDRLGLIVVDEEHEPSYKQEDSPRYHGRDVAVMRGRMEETLVVLGTATPSLETATNAASGRYEAIRLRRRVMDRPLASVRIVDMRREMAAAGEAVTFSAALLEGLSARLARGEQSLVLLNRRGFATVVFCRQCGSSLECPHCSVKLTYHRGARRMRCHYCNYAAPVPKHCAECSGEFLEQSGAGTERLEVELCQRFPGARVARVDRDTVRRRGAISRVLATVAQGRVDILVGTQMIAKGHDFPAVTLVGVVSADVGLGLADFRAAERTFQLLTQVVGRAGRGEVAGEAVVQTLYPDHYSVQAAAHQDFDAFFTRETEFRRAMQYPPAVGLISVAFRGRTLERAMADATTIANVLRRTGHGSVLGPAPAPIAKLKDEYRAQIFIKGHARRAMRESVRAALAGHPDVRRRAIVDVDPVSVI